MPFVLTREFLMHEPKTETLSLQPRAYLDRTITLSCTTVPKVPKHMPNQLFSIGFHLFGHQRRAKFPVTSSKRSGARRISDFQIDMFTVHNLCRGVRWIEIDKRILLLCHSGAEQSLTRSLLWDLPLNQPCDSGWCAHQQQLFRC